jgi:hypothetical protein
MWQAAPGDDLAETPPDLDPRMGGAGGGSDGVQRRPLRLGAEECHVEAQQHHECGGPANTAAAPRSSRILSAVSGRRNRAHLRICAELGLGELMLVHTDYSGEAGSQAVRRLLIGSRRPTVIVFDNDIMAVPGLSVAHELGLDVPGELSLVAWDDSQLTQVVRPALTELNRDIPAYGTHAAHADRAGLGRGRRGHPGPTHPARQHGTGPRLLRVTPRGGRVLTLAPPAPAGAGGIKSRDKVRDAEDTSSNSSRARAPWGSPVSTTRLRALSWPG